MISLDFEKTEEEIYSKFIYENDLIYIRRMLLMSTFLYAIFGILDFLINVRNIDVFYIIRFAIVIPMFLIAYWLSFHKSFYKYHQYIITIVYIAGGLGIVAMLAIVPENFGYYGGLFLIFGTAYFLTRLKWEFVTVGAAIIIITYIVITFLYLDEYLFNALVYSFFYVAFNVICFYGNYAAEKYRRESYLHETSLEGDNIFLEKQVYESLLDLEASNYITIYSLAKLAESRDKFTGEHIERVGSLSIKLANELNKSIYAKNNLIKEEFILSIELASTLHDIGKVGIPESILMKPGKLTFEEMEHMKTHCHIGSKTLNQITERYPKNKFINMGIEVCNFHHENWDGTGYPDKLMGTEIPLSARIVAVIDVFDALISERPYKKAYSIEKSINEMKLIRGSKFDPEILDLFVTLVEKKIISV